MEKRIEHFNTRRNRIVVFGDVVEYYIRNKKMEEVAIGLVDLEDIWVFENITWCLNSWGYAFTRRVVPHLMHNHIIKNGMVDHINRDKLDNRKSNLRMSTQSQNACNRVWATNTSGFKGVNQRDNKWRARIQIGKKRIHLGFFDDKIDAAKAYNDAAKFYHGEFALLNAV